MSDASDLRPPRENDNGEEQTTLPADAKQVFDT